MNTIYDIAIVGAGVSGSLAAFRINEKHPNLKIILIDIGRPPGKRRRQIEGFMGCLPNGDGKIYLNDLNKVLQITDGRKTNSIYQYLFDWMKLFHPMKINKDTLPNFSFQKKMKNNDWDFEKNDYVQWKPEHIHSWIKNIAEVLENSTNIKNEFDTVIDTIEKCHDGFKLISENKNFTANKILLASGRTGWRWLKNIFTDLEIPYEDDWAEFGLRIEISNQYVKDLNKSNCTISNAKKEITLGPLLWEGTIIPEDHEDLVLSTFRSNEARWHTEKLSFSLLKKIYFPGRGVDENERLTKLSFLLFNDRISKEKIKSLIKKNTILNEIKEFDWTASVLEDLSKYIPELIDKGYFYVPNIMPRPPRVQLNKNLETPVKNIFLAGEAANQFGILSAALTGMIAADGICS